MTFDQRQPDRWNGSCQARWPVALAVTQVTIFFVVLILWPKTIWGPILVVALAPLILAFRRLDVTVSAAGVTIAYGLKGWPCQHIDISDIDIHAKEILRMRSRLNQLLVSHTGQQLEQIEKDTERDHIMTADQAHEYGIIDEVVKQRA